VALRTAAMRARARCLDVAAELEGLVGGLPEATDACARALEELATEYARMQPLPDNGVVWIRAKTARAGAGALAKGA
jgi:hypothetical protein